MDIVTTGLKFPEGPVALPDGSVLVVEIARGTLSRVTPDGDVEVVAEPGGGPNGAAIGPDGKCYVCNNGGFEWTERRGRTYPGDQATDYRTGRIERIDLDTGAVEVLYESAGDVPLRGPNDIVFDASGGFWFTDHGKTRARERDRTGVFYAKADGSFIEEAIFPLEAPNGVGLSPDENELYVAETPTGRLWAFPLAAPGKLAGERADRPDGGRLVRGREGYFLFDSLAVTQRATSAWRRSSTAALPCFLLRVANRGLYPCRIGSRRTSASAARISRPPTSRSPPRASL